MKNNPNPLSLIKIQEPSVGSGTFQIIFNDSISGNQELVSSVTKQALKVQSFISVTRFSDFCGKIRYA